MKNFIESFTKDLQNAIKYLNDLFVENKISYCIIGGAALFEYGYIRLTEDIDILISKDDKNKLLELTPGFLGKKSDRVFFLHDSYIKLEIIYSGDQFNPNDIIYEEPFNISKNINGINVITLKKLIEYKIAAGLYNKKGRLKDFGDVQELIRINLLSIDFLDYVNDQNIIGRYKEIYSNTKIN